MTRVRLEHIDKYFGSTAALENINLQIEPGELFFLLGPSGCGKSTLLRLSAGLHEPSGGAIFFNDKDVTRLNTCKRNAVMCFQSYALWPHMTIRQNVAFGLEVHKVPALQAAERIEKTLKLVQLEMLAARKPNELSGGQQQRVALARALAVQPQCLLLDEPLSNLDAKLRLEMRGEIRRICKSAGFTTIYVTHDQKEALSVADRIGLLNAGRLVQVGTPSELYHTPRTSFVADFIGGANLVVGVIAGQKDGHSVVKTLIGDMLARADGGPTQSPGDKVIVSIRPEQMRMIAAGAPNTGTGIAAINRVTGRIIASTFLGETSEHLVEVQGKQLRVVAVPPVFQPPQAVTLEFAARDVLVLGE